MKSQRFIFRWNAVTIVFILFLGVTVISHSASAQEEIPPTATETPIATSAEEFSFPTTLPTPTIEESFMQSQNEVQPFALLQSMEENENRLNPEWPVFNVSDTKIASADSSIATDSTDRVHVVWIDGFYQRKCS